MSKILLINSVCNGSTGKICKDIYDRATCKGYECCIAFGRGEYPVDYNTIKIGSAIGVCSHILKTRLFDQHGFGSIHDTKVFLDKVDDYKPDIVHLHNIHGYYINVRLLFDYLKKHNEIKVIWTLHDCWSFTGHCTHFIYSKCDKWKTKCEKCPEKFRYPRSILFSNATMNHELKKQIFNIGDNLVIVTPSKWLKKMVDISFLQNNECIVINNGVDLNIFKKKDNVERIKETTILGVANIWDDRKGLNTFIQLANKLNNEAYKIIMVGLSNEQIKKLPDNIQGINKTNNVEELVNLYNQADVFFNPTLEDTYPTVNLESQACGLPVVSFNNGGTQETLVSNYSFLVDNVETFIELLKNIDFRNLNLEVDYERLDKDICFSAYIDLYGNV